MSDRDLRDALAAGDRHAFEALVERYQSALIRYATQQLGNRAIAEDAVQDAFLAVLEHRETLTTIDSLGAWLFRVTRNRALDLAKKEKRMRRRESAAAVAEATPPSTAIEDTEEERRAEEALSSLEPRTREVIVLKIREGRTYREIASITGSSLGHVSKLVHQGLAQIARRLRADGLHADRLPTEGASHP